MLNFLYVVYNFVINSFVELILYVLVDVVAKSSLREGRDESEKRQIWLYESLVLVCATTMLYLFHHTPYILIALSVFTLVYTQLLGRVNFRFWWSQFKNRWDEFQQHEESMEHYHELQSRKTVVPNVVASQSNWIPPSVTVGTSGFTFDPNSVEPWYPSDNGSQTGPPASIPQPQGTNSMPPNITPTSHLRQRFSANPEFQAPQPIYSNSPIMSHRTPMVPLGRPELIRRPLHSYLASPMYQNKPVLKTQGFQSAIKSKFMAAFGITQSDPHPPGLPNNGQNICFVNSVLQCLAYSPRLAICLNRDSKSLKCGMTEAGLVLATNELLQNMTKLPDVDTPRVLNHTVLREAASQLRGTVVLDPKKGEQHQQDTSEFLMWILDCLHTALNAARPAVVGNTNSENQTNYQNMSLQMLKFIYGDLSPPRVVELKKACRKEIESANSLNSETYGEPIQRLTDLEWLTYKENNNSIIDDLFTGQMVEAQRCVACNRISVSIQTFTILPVPIVEPRQLNGLVYLEDCFTKFGTTEDLYGPDGLRCECCNKNATSTPILGYPMNGPLSSPQFNQAKAEFQFQHAASLAASPVLSNGGVDKVVLNMNRRRILRSDSGLTSSSSQQSTAMSPIQASAGEGFNDSGFHDNQLKTSTPIHNTAPHSKLTDGQRRSLLRQLPECLVVQLMRFSHSFGELNKLLKPVSVPLTGLDLTHLIIDNVMQREDLTGYHNNFRYDLYGVCVHLGGDCMSSGHYIAYTKVHNGTWYKFDDESVVAVNMEYELTTKQLRENAYLLFFRKCGNQ